MSYQGYVYCVDQVKNYFYFFIMENSLGKIVFQSYLNIFFRIQKFSEKNQFWRIF